MTPTEHAENIMKNFNADTFRLYIFEILEHHLEMIEESYDHENIVYQVSRCREAAAYLKKCTVHIPLNEKL